MLKKSGRSRWISPVSYLVGTGVLSQGVQQPRDEIAHSPHLDPRLRMSVAIPLLPLYAFMLWIVTTLYLL